MSDRLTAAAVQLYLRGALGRPELVVTGLHQIAGGASRATWNVDVRATPDGPHEGIILRLDPDASVLESARHVEYAIYSTLAGGSIPVPPVVAVEDDPSILGATFFVMRRVEGTSSAAALAGPEAAERRARLTPQVVRVLADLRRTRPGAVPIAPATVDVAEAWRVELDHWEMITRRDEPMPHALAHAALRRLRRQPPKPSAELCLVHGDFRTGNFMFDEGGTMTAVLDWEMAHVGDPLENVGWFCARPWRTDSAADGDVGSLAPREELLRAYEEQVGEAVDREAVAWWELLGLVKLLALFFTGGAQVAAGRSTNPLLASLPLTAANWIERLLLDEMGR